MVAVLKELEVPTTTVSALLILDLVLHDERFFREVEGFSERGRNGMVGGLGLCDQPEVAFDDRRRGLLYGPLANVAESLAPNRRLLRRL